jgi:hypothetical protein
MIEYKIITMPDDPDPVESVQAVYQTPKYLFDMGMCLCHSCGKLHSIDYAFCNTCFREIFIDIIPGEKPDDAKVMEVIKKHRKK